MHVTARETNFVAPPGGVMTDEVGTVTGELTLRTELTADGAVQVLVQYLGAAEWYRVTGAPTSLPPDTTLDALHERVLGELRGRTPDTGQ
ncbi:MAG: hypothetical protein IRY85_08440 [Micromonosporaceae bacterium]|nr:hypothetical protein [Micromonosporaceae bacterium]